MRTDEVARRISGTYTQSLSLAVILGLIMFFTLRSWGVPTAPGVPPTSLATEAEDPGLVCSINERTHKLRDMCRTRDWVRHLEPSRSKLFWRLLSDDQHQMLYCVIPKVACTTFKTIMVNETEKASGYDHLRVHNIKFLRYLGLFYLDQHSTEGRLWRLNNYTKFIIVRHPFDRLLSAYTDKFVEHDYYPRKFRSKILRRFNESAVQGNGRVQLSLSQFLELIVRDYHNGFIDRHWMSYYDLCWPCDVQYDHILKLETIEYDSRSFVDQLHDGKADLNENTDSDSRPLTKMNQARAKSDKLREVTRIFQRIDPEIVKALQAIYRADFELFGYSWDAEKGATCDTTSTDTNPQICC